MQSVPFLGSRLMPELDSQSELVPSSGSHNTRMVSLNLGLILVWVCEQVF